MCDCCQLRVEIHSIPQGFRAASHGVRSRIAGYEEIAHQRGLLSKKVALVNLSQTAGYSKQVNFRTAPALLRNTYLFDLISLSELPPVLNWLIMGLPVPGLVSPELAQRFPFPSVVSACKSELSDNQVRIVTGNAMHQAAIGAWLALGLACTKKHFRNAPDAAC